MNDLRVPFKELVAASGDGKRPDQQTHVSVRTCFFGTLGTIQSDQNDPKCVIKQHFDGLSNGWFSRVK